MLTLSAKHSSYPVFFLNDTATTEIYTLSLHDALPISLGTRSSPGRARRHPRARASTRGSAGNRGRTPGRGCLDRKSTRLNSSHDQISYAVFCLKKKKPSHYSGILHSPPLTNPLLNTSL